MSKARTLLPPTCVATAPSLLLSAFDALKLTSNLSASHLSATVTRVSPLKSVGSPLVEQTFECTNSLLYAHKSDARHSRQCDKATPNHGTFSSSRALQLSLPQPIPSPASVAFSPWVLRLSFRVPCLSPFPPLRRYSG